MPLNVVVSGLGRIAWRYHLPTIQTDSRFNLLAVSDPVEERRREAEATYPGLRTYSDFHEMLKAEQSADMAVIASPTMFHREQTIAALERHLAVFLEKPMCESLASARQVAEAVERTGSKLMLYQPHRHYPEYLIFNRMVREKLGVITHSRRILARFNRRNDWQSRSSQGGGMLNNYGAHYIDQFLAAFGPGPIKIKGALLQRTVSIGDAEDLVNVLLESPSGVTGNVEINLGSAVSEDSWQVFGTLGCARFSAESGQWDLTYVKPGTLPELTMQEGLAAQDRAYSVEGTIPWIHESIPLSAVTQPSYYDFIYDYFALGKAPFVPLTESMELMRILNECRTRATAEA